MVNPYDEVLYAGHPFAQTHPDRLATLARLFGMRPAAVESCRVMELGCADGANLIPMAYELPCSEFVGLDAGGRGIAKGQALAGELRLRNLSLQHLDILEAGADLGAFDYIIAHGVYSWVPPAVQDRILRLCHEHLKPQGVAYISYSTYPGGHLKAMIAGMLKYHVRSFSQPAEQIEQARALLAFLAQAKPARGGYTSFLQQQLDVLAMRRPQTLYHDELAEIQSPLYFHEFAAHAARHELQYLAEADFFEMQDSALPAEASAMLRKLDMIAREQYLDFLKCRAFRQTLLCHAGVPLNRRLESAQMRDFYVGSAARPESPPQTGQPLAQTALALVAEAWPRALKFDELLDALRARTGACEDDAAMLADVILAYFASGWLQLHVHEPRFTVRVSARPRASALARLQVRDGPFVTNLRHDVVRMEDELGRRLLAVVDGTRDRAALLDDLVEAVSSGAIAIPDAPAEPVALRQFLDKDLDGSLEGIAACALLEE